jgi:hypothetical protein
MAAGTRNLHIFDTKADQAAAEDLGLAPDAAVVAKPWSANHCGS